MAKDKDKKKKKKKDKSLTPEQALLAALGLNPDKVTIVEVDKRDAAQTTVGILTAAQGIHYAHDHEQDCSTFHSALSDLTRKATENPVMASLVIKHLAYVGSQVLSPEDLQDLGMATYLEADDDEH